MNLPQIPKRKMPPLKVPGPVADVYVDLRERRLLPLVALVAVAIAAVPFLLSDEERVSVPPTAVEVSDAAAGGDGPTLAVVEATPGLRDWRKRLGGRTPTNPFKQRYTGVPKGAQLRVTDSGAGGEGGGGGEPAPAPGSSEGDSGVGLPPLDPGTSEQGGGSPGSGGAPSGDDGDHDGQRYFGFRPDVRFGVAGSGDLKLYRELPVGSLLPKSRPVLVFIGVSENGKRASFTLDSSVTSVRGDANCIGGHADCRLLFLRVGQAVDLLTDTPGRVFRLSVQGIEFVEVEIPKASSGDRSEPGSASRARSTPKRSLSGNPNSLSVVTTAPDQNFSK